ncbi:hypothetical protein O181_078639 [Austropuccinia psidii MF-1]|uniref:Carboxylesterase type B domain-containing protein n=1 Tax=Austropuccinia psidii MF-1 TaxID=1389203 RepID=A0A9Q3FHB0_9BASI|nr:hypothetical protein [Austropuccinia psidii MF-1]
MPPLCPQETLSSLQSMSEDCLFITVYAPRLTTRTSPKRMPLIAWVHGGSFIQGGSTNYGLDGSFLAHQNGMVVVVIQYRLGLLGFLKTSASQTQTSLSGNYAVKDVMMALSFIKEIAPAFGADRQSLTLAGQSSGADMIKTLLVIESAAELFDQAILHSSPLNYGDQSINTADKIGAMALSLFNQSSDSLRNLPVERILEVQTDLMAQIPQAIPGVAFSEPFRPVIDNTLIKNDFIYAINHPQNSSLFVKNRNIILTTVRDEAAPTISSAFNDLTSSQQLPVAIESALGTAASSRFVDIQASGVYSRELRMEAFFDHNETKALKDTLSVFGTDYIWRCANQQVAVNLTRNYPSSNGKGFVWLAEFDLGIPYTSSQAIPYCRGKVCHEDDILPLFGIPSDYNMTISFSERKLMAEVGRRWGAFVTDGSPNSKGYINWPPVSSDKRLNMLRLGGICSKIDETQRPWACSEAVGLWGRKVPFDAQIYT